MEAVKSLFTKVMMLPDEVSKQDVIDLGIPEVLYKEIINMIEVKNFGRLLKWVASCYDPNSKEIKIEKNRRDLKLLMVEKHGLTNDMFVNYANVLILVDDRDEKGEGESMDLDLPIAYLIDNYFPPVVRLVSWYLDNSRSPVWALIVSAKECMIEFMEVARSRVVYSFIDPDKLMKAYSNKADCLSKAMAIQEKLDVLESNLRYSLKDIEEVLEQEFNTDYSNSNIVEQRIERLARIKKAVNTVKP